MLMKVKYIISWTLSAEFNLIETQCFAVFLSMNSSLIGHPYPLNYYTWHFLCVALRCIRFPQNLIERIVDALHVNLDLCTTSNSARLQSYEICIQFEVDGLYVHLESKEKSLLHEGILLFFFLSFSVNFPLKCGAFVYHSGIPLGATVASSMASANEKPQKFQLDLETLVLVL